MTDPRMTTTDAPVTVEQLVKAAADAYAAFVEARQRMNAAIPALDATPAERAVYDERYRADHAAEREHWRTAIELAQNAHRLAALASAPAGSNLQKMQIASAPAGDGVEDDPDHQYAVVSANYSRPFLVGAYPTLKAALVAQDGKPKKWHIYQRASLARPRAAVGEQSRASIARAVHGALSRANINAYLHMPDDTAEKVADAILALQSPPAKVEEE